MEGFVVLEKGSLWWSARHIVVTINGGERVEKFFLQDTRYLVCRTFCSESWMGGICLLFVEL